MRNHRLNPPDLATRLILLVVQFRLGRLSSHEIREETEALTTNRNLHAFLAAVLDHLAFLRGDPLPEPPWRWSEETGQPLMDLLIQVLQGLVSFEGASPRVKALDGDPLVFAFFVKALTYLPLFHGTRLPAPLREAMEKYLRGHPPVPMDMITPTDWAYEYLEDGGGD